MSASASAARVKRETIPELVPVSWAASRLGVTPRTVRRWIAEGKLRKRVVGNRWKVVLDDVLALLDSDA